MEDLLIAAINEAGRKVDQEVQRITQGLARRPEHPGPDVGE